jgi:hypothetical protein
VFKQALVEDGIPDTSLALDDVAAVRGDLKNRGVRFAQAPTTMGPVITAILDDNCGNLIQSAVPHSRQPGAQPVATSKSRRPALSSSG